MGSPLGVRGKVRKKRKNEMHLSKLLTFENLILSLFLFAIATKIPPK